MSVYVNNLVEEEPLSEALTGKLVEMVNFLLREYRLEHGEVGIILAGDGRLQQLNRSYRGIDSPTDVLSFGLIDPGELEQAMAQTPEQAGQQGELLVGDIYISLDRAKEQALEAGHHPHREIMLLAVHGMLHLLGYEHAGAKDKTAMRKKEEEILRQVE